MSARPTRVLSLLAVQRDDEADAALVQAVAREGVEVAWVEPHSLEGGLALPESTPFDAVLLDARTDPASAFGVLDRVRETCPDLAVVVVTDDQGSSVGAELVSAGADDSLVRSDVDRGVLGRALRYAVERHRLEKEIASLGLTDPVTGLRNRRGLLTIASQVLNVAARYRLNVAAVTVHLEEGPAPGPRHLARAGARREFAAMLRRAVRSSDVVACVAEAEFVVLMLDPGPDGVGKLLDRLERERDRRAERADATARLHWTAGEADQTWGTHELLENLLDRSARAMYRSVAADTGLMRVGDASPKRPADLSG